MRPLVSAYHPGQRRDWIKVKNIRHAEVIIGGWRPGQGRRTGTIGLLPLGVPDADRLRYAGHVGTGFSSRGGLPSGWCWIASTMAHRSSGEPCLSVPPCCVNQWQALAAAADGHRPGLWHVSPLVPAAAWSWIRRPGSRAGRRPVAQRRVAPLSRAGLIRHHRAAGTRGPAAITWRLLR
jgi:hypothetical protein